jgi:hypothetical protein
MKILVGLPMHNAGACVVEAIKRIDSEMNLNAAIYKLLLINDWSTPEEMQKVRDFLMDNPRFQQIVKMGHSVELFPGSPSPNLGKILNYCLDQMPEDYDYYLNLESDVYLQHGCLWHLMEAMRTTGAPMACPIQATPDGIGYDFIFWGAGIIEGHVFRESQQFRVLQSQQRPKWCNLGCLLVRGDVARDFRVRVDEQFNLFCVDQDYTSTVAQAYGRPVYEPKARVVHVGRQSTREGQPGGHRADDAVRRIDQKWAGYIQGGLFG